MISVEEPSAGASLIQAFADGLGKELLMELAQVKAGGAAQEKYDLLARKNSDGTLTPEERAELESLVQVSEVLSALKTEARQRLEKAA